MGAKRPDRIPAEVWRERWPDVGSMARGHLEVISACPVCELKMKVNLALICRVSGPGLSLWNRREPCRRLGCTGRVRFMALFPGTYTHQFLTSSEVGEPQPPLGQVRRS